ncbi:TolB family protein [Fulvivirga lutea]|uniref:PD40 domain-containing protein n=1 Tax=Fulvivirga lutea TaxID=2810512 RepID=A0A974WHR5_9BACT|nr:PD40 domain-containing protein [Fulvivirga lutea]QSE97958.1 PD40 domain-containing protein [Fulvivirga lutea]
MKLVNIILSFGLILFGFFTTVGQEQLRKLPPNINQPSVNLYAPVVSGDGETLVYLSDYTDDGSLSMNFTTRKTISSWNEPTEVSKVVNRPTLNYQGGYCLSFDGQLLIFTSRKSGLGGFELWYSERQGNNWGAPVNFGRPINSASNEGTPSLSPDGEKLYFMRCDGMTELKGARGCQIYVSTKKYGKWQEPEPLPATINTGNSQNPKILADGETLIFSSDQMGGKGGLDLFMSKNQGGTWTKPVPMDFMNTPQDDQFISIPSKGRYAFAAQNTGKDHQLVEVLLPDEFKPKKVMRIEGIVTDKSSGERVNAKLVAFNVDLRDRIWNDNIGENGEFALVLNEGNTYDLSVLHPNASYQYYSKIYDLETVGRRDKERLKIELVPLTKGLEFQSDIFFKDASSEIDDRSTYELRRLSDMIRRNESINLEIILHQTNYKEDSVMSSDDLTEVIVDSTYIEKVVAIPVSSDVSNSDVDSLLTVLNEPDSLHTPVKNDSIGSISKPQTKIVKELVINKTYHNDRTKAQGESIKAYFVEKGADESAIKIKTKKSKRSDEPEEGEQDVKVTIKILSL